MSKGLVCITLARGGPAVVLAIRTGLSLVVLSARAVKIPQHTVTSCFILTWVGLTEVRVPMALHLRTQSKTEQKNEQNK